MSASTNDKITDVRNAARPNSARVTSGRSAAGTTLACDNLSGWPTASKVHFVTYTIDSNSNPVAGTQLDCYGIVSGNNIGSFTVVDGNDTGNSIGDVVEMLPTAAWGQDLADALTTSHNRDGTIKDGAISTASMLGSSVVTTAKINADAIDNTKLADASVLPEQLVSGAGTSWAWQSWTPTFTNLTLGNGTLSCKYIQTGKNIRFKFYLLWGSTTSVSGSVSFSLPVTSVAVDGVGGAIGQVILYNGAATFQGPLVHGSTTTAILRWYQASGTAQTGSNISSTSPDTWVTAAQFHAKGDYEAA